MITILLAVSFAFFFSSCNGFVVSSLNCNTEALMSEEEGFSTGQQSLDKVSVYLQDAAYHFKTSLWELS